MDVVTEVDAQIMAVVHLFGPLSLFYRFWRISFPDFAASMVSFWVTIFVSAEMGIGAAVGWSIVYTMLRSTFVKPVIHSSGTDGNSGSRTPVQPAWHIRTNGGGNGGGNDSRIENVSIAIPDDAVVVAFTDAVFFPNADRAKATILEAIQLVYPPVEARQITDDDSERSWSVAGARRLERLRAQRRLPPKETSLAVVVWDFSMVPFVDMTGIMALGELKDDIRMHANPNVQIRMVGMSDRVRSRFLRSKWSLVDTEEWREDGADVVYQSMERAIWDRDGAALEAVTSSEKV
jgi:sodium-independent sulfate anion transporter 11